MGPLLGSILGPVISGLLGGDESDTPVSSDSMGPGPLVTGGDSAAAPSLGSQLGEGLRGSLLNAVLGPLNAHQMGRNQLAYNRSAYPGVPAWETTGSGSAGAAAGGSPDLVQRERESKRAAQVQLQTSRMGAASSLAGEAMRQGGAANGRFIESLMRSGGLLPAGAALDLNLMQRGHVESEIASLDQGTRRSAALLDPDVAKVRQETGTSQAQEHNLRLDAALKPYYFALDEWKARFGDSYGANEVRGLSAILDEMLGRDTPLAGDFTADFMRRVKAAYPEFGDGDLFQLGQMFNAIP